MNTPEFRKAVFNVTQTLAISRQSTQEQLESIAGEHFADVLEHLDDNNVLLFGTGVTFEDDLFKRHTVYGLTEAGRSAFLGQGLILEQG